MAKRRKLEAPSADELAGIEAEFARPGSGTGPLVGVAPIAQIAGSTARRVNAPSTTDGQDAVLWRQAEAEGRVMRNLSIDRIVVDHITRDRTALDPEAMEELIASVRTAGVRLPVEVTSLGDGTYGLISGYRRITAVRALREEGGAGTVPAIVRGATDLGESYARMVEENEVRSQITPYERGRIAVVAAGQGAYPDTGTAVGAIFASASKAKRSKIRSFATVHEELGDLLRHPQGLSERNGLRLANALRAGFATKLREVLEEGAPTAAAEWAALEVVVREAEAKGPQPERGGRPKRANDEERLRLPNGATLVVRVEPGGVLLRLSGSHEWDAEDLAGLARRWVLDRARSAEGEGGLGVPNEAA